MIHIEQKDSTEAGRCQGCASSLPNRSVLNYPVYVLTVSRNPIMMNELRFCLRCLEDLREEVAKIIPF
jgi:hypothetical protein